MYVSLILIVMNAMSVHRWVFTVVKPTIKLAKLSVHTIQTQHLLKTERQEEGGRGIQKNKYLKYENNNNSKQNKNKTTTKRKDLGIATVTNWLGFANLA